jgi:hypothetical protein
MPYTREEAAAIEAVFDNLPQEVKDLLSAKSTQDTAAAICAVIGKKRKASMAAAVDALVTGAVSDWAALSYLATVADGAVTLDALTEFLTALVAEDADKTVAAAVAACFAARKHFGLPIPEPVDTP